MDEKIKPVIIGAPFGNYLNFNGATSTLGTFTWERRGGFFYRVWRAVKTVRYYPGIGAWKNKLGLPNPGIQSLKGSYEGKIISIAAFNFIDWIYIIDYAIKCNPIAIELNISCPNMRENIFDSDYFQAIRRYPSNHRKKFIIKLPPINFEDILKESIYHNIFNFHCCNTLPISSGGLSGKPLKPLSLKVVEEARILVNSQGIKDFCIIGGGGITSIQDAADYFSAGATNISIASMLFFPWNWLTVRKIISYT